MPPDLCELRVAMTEPERWLVCVWVVRQDLRTHARAYTQLESALTSATERFINGAKRL